MPTVSIRGQLKGPKGRPARGVWVRLTDRRKGRTGSGYVSGTRTNKAGEFELSGLLPDSNALFLESEGQHGNLEHGPIKLKGKRLGIAGLKLKLRAPVQIEGQVKDRRGKALPGARVTLVKAEDGDRDEFILGPNTITDREGRFTLRGMKPGEYVLQVRMLGNKAAARSKPFKVGKRRSIKKQIRLRR